MTIEEMEDAIIDVYTEIEGMRQYAINAGDAGRCAGLSDALASMRTKWPWLDQPKGQR